MGYYLDLHFRDETKQPKPKEFETLFCEHGCKKWDTETSYRNNLNEYVEVEYFNEEYDVSMLIQRISLFYLQTYSKLIIETIKYLFNY